jgi:hypothetical protein
LSTREEPRRAARKFLLGLLSWTDDRDRCRAASVPDEVGFATKVTHGRRMISRALDAGVPAAWVTADEFHGDDGAIPATDRVGEVGGIARLSGRGAHVRNRR